jgi:protein involved in polysaccharide export with SLBB domain
VRFGGVYKYAENTTIEDLILQAGGLSRVASTAKIDVYRHLYDPAAMEGTEKTSEKFSFELKDGFVVEDGERFVLQPYDEVYVHRSPVSREIQSVSIDGAVNFAGHYAMLSKNYRLSELLEAAGGVSTSAYVKGAYMKRRMTEEEIAQRDIMRNNSQLSLYEEILRSDNDVNISVLDSIYKGKFNEENYFSLAIDLEKALKEPGGEFDVVLREGDVVVVPEYNSTVRISGEVMHPVAVSWQAGKNLGYYIDHAGGFANKAKKNGVYVINMNGSVEKVSKFSKAAIQPGCEIVVPRKGDRGLSAAEISTLGATGMSITTMIVALINLLK